MNAFLSKIAKWRLKVIGDRGELEVTESEEQKKEPLGPFDYKTIFSLQQQIYLFLLVYTF